MLVPDERKLYQLRFPRPDEVKESLIIEAMQAIERLLGSGGSASVVIEEVFKDDIIRRLNYSGWEVKPIQGKDTLFEVVPKEVR